MKNNNKIEERKTMIVEEVGAMQGINKYDEPKVSLKFRNDITNLQTFFAEDEKNIVISLAGDTNYFLTIKEEDFEKAIAEMQRAMKKARAAWKAVKEA